MAELNVPAFNVNENKPLPNKPSSKHYLEEIEESGEIFVLSIEL